MSFLALASIGSSTFYAHYFDKEDVQIALIEQMLEQLSPTISQKSVNTVPLPSLALFRHIQEYSQHFQALMRGHTEENVWKVAQTTLSKSIEQAFARTSTEKHSPPIPSALAAHYLAGAFLSLLKWWIETEMPYLSKRMDEIFQ